MRSSSATTAPASSIGCRPRIDALTEVVDAVGDATEVWIDGGVRRGLDIAIAVALGARGVLIGKPVFWALAAGGQAGVERAMAILARGIRDRPGAPGGSHAGPTDAGPRRLRPAPNRHLSDTVPPPTRPGPGMAG